MAKFGNDFASLATLAEFMHAILLCSTIKQRYTSRVVGCNKKNVSYCI